MAHMKRFERGYLRHVREQRGGQLYAYQQKAPPPPPLPRTNRTSLVPLLVLSGHAVT